jgi:hypothetical protein
MWAHRHVGMWAFVQVGMFVCRWACVRVCIRVRLRVSDWWGGVTAIATKDENTTITPSHIGEPTHLFQTQAGGVAREPWWCRPTGGCEASKGDSGVAQQGLVRLHKKLVVAPATQQVLV